MALVTGLATGLRPVGFEGQRPTLGGSEEGGFEELVEFWPSLASNSAIRARAACNCPVSMETWASSSVMRASRAASWASSSAMRASLGSAQVTPYADHILACDSIPF